jgi:excisionase family DNA binding protein
MISKARANEASEYNFHPWTVNDVARAYSVSRRTVAEWQKIKRIPFLKIGKVVRFNPGEVRLALQKFQIKTATF